MFTETVKIIKEKKKFVWIISLQIYKFIILSQIVLIICIPISLTAA